MNKSNNILFIILLLFIIFIAIYCKLFFWTYNETLINDKDIVFKSWWGEPPKETYAFFRKIFNDVLKNYDNMEIHSVSSKGPINKNKKTLYIQYSGESYYIDPSMFDINFIPTDKIENNIVIFPFASWYILHDAQVDPFYFLKKRQLIDNIAKQNFCLFSVSNGENEHRNIFFKTLSEKYKKVDSCGGFMNNMGTNCPGTFVSKEYCEFVSRYKFMICFENSSVPNYFTEKLISAYYCGTIPIYWGCPNISDYVNMDSILYLKPDYTQSDVDALIKEIKLLDENDDLYKKKFESVFFKNGNLPDSFNLDKIREKVNNVFERTGDVA